MSNTTSMNNSNTEVIAATSIDFTRDGLVGRFVTQEGANYDFSLDTTAGLSIQVNDGDTSMLDYRCSRLVIIPEVEFNCDYDFGKLGFIKKLISGKVGQAILRWGYKRLEDILSHTTISIAYPDTEVEYSIDMLGMKGTTKASCSKGVGMSISGEKLVKALNSDISFSDAFSFSGDVRAESTMDIDGQPINQTFYREVNTPADCLASWAKIKSPFLNVTQNDLRMEDVIHGFGK